LGAAEPVEVSSRAIDLVLASRVVDMLGLLTLDWQKLFSWQTTPAAFEEPDYRGLEVSGVDVFHPAVETSYRDAYAGALHWITGWNRLLDAKGCYLTRVDSLDRLQNARRRGKVGVIVGFQNSNHFRATGDVAAFYALGQRISQLTYNEKNELGSGCYVRRDRGLTDFGGEIVAEMNRLGMAIDVSHCGERTSRETIAASRRPVIVSHANCAALVPGQPRCKSDRVIREMAARGGVIGITLVRAFVAASTRPTLENLLDHFDHVRKIAGIEHVGLGSDVDVTARDPANGRALSFYALGGLDPTARVYQIADGLLRRGYSAREVELVLGENFVRALGEIWIDRPRFSAGGLDERRDPFCPAPHRMPPPEVVRVGDPPAERREAE
ncbi:MAG TPA: membrane dipeptidase, partial [Thermoanaerobaculia bacterium]|nr:membrane dipeptidase [Thermoanaerobaculia bacterium]